MCADCDSKKQYFLRLFKEKVVIRSSIVNTDPFNQYFIINCQFEDLLRMNNRKVVHSQGRQIIYNVYQFMEKEKEEELTTPLPQLQERVAEATGVSLSIVRRIIKEGGSTFETSQRGSSKFSLPRKTVTRPRPKSTLDKFNEEIIRKIIYSFIDNQKCAPPVSKVLEEVKCTSVEFEGTKTTFWKVLRNLGFR
ncbi:hypothetical protein FQA39_LY03670 [Lamprigera yunnana]|nr:hypothetical protein FQA39_LY03670 [Lamprigera yunnana]